MDDPAAPPERLMQALDFDGRCRAQLKHYRAVTQYTFCAEANDCETAVDLRVQTGEWSDMADWEVSVEDILSEE
jgi:hypothetical protein